MANYEPDPGSGPIHVDIQGLTDFAGQLRTAVERVEAELADKVRAYHLGVTVGDGMPSPGMAEVRQFYALCLRRTVEQLGLFVRTGHVLADAAEQIATRYRTADELAAAPLADVKAALTAARTANPDPVVVPADPGRPVHVNGETSAV